MVSQPFHSLGTCARSSGPRVVYVMYLSILICIYIYTCWCMFILNIWAHTHIYIHIFEKDRLVFSVNCTVSLSPTVNSWYMHLCNWLFVALCIYIYIPISRIICMLFLSQECTRYGFQCLRRQWHPGQGAVSRQQLLSSTIFFLCWTHQGTYVLSRDITS